MPRMLWLRHARYIVSKVRREPTTCLVYSYATSGGDVHVAGDGNFMHRHKKSAGDCPNINLPKGIVVPTPFIDSVGDAMIECGKLPPRSYVSEVSEAVLKQCASSHTAGDGSREKTTGEAFDDRGLMAFVCRHDIPLFVCNIDTPGEQQKFFIGLLIWLLLHLPDTAMVTTWYDMNCLAWRMLMAVCSPLLSKHVLMLL